MIRKALIGAAMVAATLLGSTPSAQAWTKVKNNSANMIWVAYAHIAMEGVGCGYTTCRQGDAVNFSNAYRVRGWWGIAPGGSATVNGNAHHNATRHQVYAEDAFGNWWGGDGRIHGVFRPQAFDYCKRNLGEQWWGPPGSVWTDFFEVPVARCCGFWCGGVNYTQGLN